MRTAAMSSGSTSSFHKYSGSVGEALGRLESPNAEPFSTMEIPELLLIPGTIATFGSVNRRGRVHSQALPECLQVRQPPIPPVTPSPTHLHFSGSVCRATSRLQVQPHASLDNLNGEPSAHARPEEIAMLGSVRRRGSLRRTGGARIANRAKVMTLEEEQVQGVKVSPKLPSRKQTSQFDATPVWKQKILRIKHKFCGSRSAPLESGPGLVHPTTASSNGDKSAKKQSRFILDRTIVVLRRGVPRRVLRRRKSRNNREPDPRTYSQTQAAEGQYLPSITTTITRPKVVERRGNPDLSKLPRRRSHVLNPCGHTILTHRPSRCGRNCACKLFVEPNVFSEQPLKSHPCVVCIDEHLDAKYTAKNDRIILASRPVLKPILGNEATKDLLAKRLKTYNKIWHAERGLTRRNMLVNQAEANGMNRNSIGYVLTDAIPGPVGPKSHTRPSSTYRGLDRSDNLSIIRTKVSDSKRSEAWKVARRRNLILRRPKNEKSSTRKLTLSGVMDEAVNREFWIDDQGEWQVQRSVL